MILKQSQTYVRLFMMIQSADHISGLTGASPAVKISQAGAVPGTAANSPAVEVQASTFPGLYKISLAAADTGTLGDLAFHCTAASADPTDFIDQVQATIFPDLSLDANGNANISSTIKKNTALSAFMFLMTSSVTGQALIGATVTAQRSLNGAAFAPCANASTEIGNGIYSLNLAATDTNANTILLRLTATGANDLDILLLTQP